MDLAADAACDAAAGSSVGGYVKFVPMITSRNWYQFCMESQNGGQSYADFNSHSRFNDPTPLPVVTIDGVEYTFGLGTLDFGEALLQFGSGEAHFAVDKRMTADELNDALSTAGKLHAFLRKADPDAYRAYRLSAANSFTGDYSIILDLPAVEYDKPIVLAADRAVRGGI